MNQIAIVTPVLNDWESLNELVNRLNELPPLAKSYHITVIAVDDGSIEVSMPQIGSDAGSIAEVKVLGLKANQGHQRAIALGLAYVHRELDVTLTIVMDSDGEDLPENIPDMIAAHEADQGAIIVAQRKRRSEGFGFKIFYQIYKLVFAMLTGKSISFGNFSLIPMKRLPNVIFASGIWINFAATMLKGRIPIKFVETDRGKRYFGESKMNFTSLMLHGFSAISVFNDVVIGRIMSFLVIVSVCVGIGVFGIIGIRLTTTIFVPGYATYLIMFLLTLLAIAMFTGFLSILSLLANRDRAAALPSRLLDDYLSAVKTITFSTNTN